ncbi:Crp/Fnr family transcriptional regulator [Mucilaginibacter kameinonensis]|uniref:Crp/Fnr family transcriptional regulator n=1 Tax=Mucilaginibacter kameinonensis TaxID=452286 RepID=UPI001FCA20B2|nr:Crp/Fnr family transcriptional regulator [Mucilaginibacter kameinonensis]
MYANNIPSQNTSETGSNVVENVNYRMPRESAVRTLAGPAHWALFKYITGMSGMSLTDQQKTLIVESVKLKKLRKRQYFLQEGDFCKHIGFIIKGSTRMFSINERGQESIVAFGLENNWITDQASFNQNECSVYHIEMMEDTELLMLNRSQIELLMGAVPAFAQMFSEYQKQQLIYNQKRINAALSMTAEERYYDLLKSEPQYSRRFSQNMLACYLGVKPETISRIRKNNL